MLKEIVAGHLLPVTKLQWPKPPDQLQIVAAHVSTHPLQCLLHRAVLCPATTTLYHQRMATCLRIIQLLRQVPAPVQTDREAVVALAATPLIFPLFTPRRGTLNRSRERHLHIGMLLSVTPTVSAWNRSGVTTRLWRTPCQPHPLHVSSLPVQ